VSRAKLGRTAHVSDRRTGDHRGVNRLHLIADDLADDKLETWADDGLRELEAYLEKHAAFATFLETQEA
jgi:hypothetical protein